MGSRRRRRPTTACRWATCPSITQTPRSCTWRRSRRTAPRAPCGSRLTLGRLLGAVPV